MYEILKEINSTTFIGCRDSTIYILKKLHPEDMEIYSKLMRLDCENLAKVYEIACVDGEEYAVCEYVCGHTLREHLEEHGTFSDYEVKVLGGQLCDGLNAMHAADMIHRDIKPENVMISNGGTVKIIDFGIARLRKEKMSSDTEILGTHGYAAPEQYGFSQSSNKTDIYAVGVLLNYMKTGCLPIEKHAVGEIGRIVRKCTRMDAGSRYKDVRHVKWALYGGNKFNRALSYVPGFGRGIIHREILAVIYYVLSVALAVSFFTTEPPPDNDISTWEMGLTVLIILLLPVPFIGNSGSWTEKWRFTENKSKAVKIAVRVAFGLGAAVFALFLLLVVSWLRR